MGHYDSFFWCTCGQHYVKKVDAVVDWRGSVRCPKHKRMIRLRPGGSGKKRDRLYPRSRVA